MNPPSTRNTLPVPCFLPGTTPRESAGWRGLTAVDPSPKHQSLLYLSVNMVRERFHISVDFS
eukprot:scaffold13948_cov207-Alexandrium_tamarense.AAC.4